MALADDMHNDTSREESIDNGRLEALMDLIDLNEDDSGTRNYEGHPEQSGPNFAQLRYLLDEEGSELDSNETAAERGAYEGDGLRGEWVYLNKHLLPNDVP
jgi:hypothetical protein